MTTGTPVEPRWPSILWDVTPALALLIVGVVTADPERGRFVPAQLLVIVPLLVRRLWPTAVFVLVGFLAATTSMEAPTPWIHAGAVALASYTMGDLIRDRIRGAVIVLPSPRRSPRRS